MPSTNTPEALPGSQPGGMLFKLPPEVRLQIYEMMFPRDEVNLFSIRDNLVRTPNPNPTTGDYLTVLATCRAIHDEAKPVLYSNTRIIIYCSWQEDSTLYSEEHARDGGYSDSTVDLRQARKLSIRVFITGEDRPRSDSTWMDRMPAIVNSIPELKDLGITIRPMQTEGDVSVDIQEEADYALSLLGKIRCKGRVLVAMYPQLILKTFKWTSYCAMLQEVGGEDATTRLYYHKLVVLLNRQESILQELNAATSQLVPRAVERADIRKDYAHWNDRPDSRARASQLSDDIETLMLDISRLEGTIKSIQDNIHDWGQQVGSLFVEIKKLPKST